MRDMRATMGLAHNCYYRDSTCGSHWFSF